MPINWTARVWQEYRAGNLTRAWRDVLLTLHTYRGTGGLCTPSHATLAARAKCSSSTVLRACQQGQQLGLLEWAERRIRRGWRWLRTSNAYRLIVPEGAIQAGLGAVRRTNRQKSAGGERKSNQGAIARLIEATATLPDLLAARRAAMEARFQASARAR